MATVEERFQAAVNVIKGLPKNGPYQPSTTMMLKFYGYFKHATEGPCTQKKPAFWDVVGKAKWDAWNSNRHLTKQQAMAKYVDELREIIETMSYTDNVANFVGSISSLDNINLDELEMVAPGMREMAESHPNSPFSSRTNSPQHGVTSNPAVNESASTSAADITTTADPDPPAVNGHYSPSGTISKSHLNGDIAYDANERVAPAAKYASNSYAVSNGTVDQSDDEYGDPVDMQHEFTEAMLHNSELLKQVQATVLRMNADLVSVNQRIGVLEKGVQEVRLAVQQKSLKALANTRGRNAPKWWPFDDISPAWFALLVLWPFLVNRLSRLLLKQRRK